MAQIMTPILTIIGLVYVARQLLLQSALLHSGRLHSLYQDLDTASARGDRAFIYKRFARIKKPTTAQRAQARRVLASLDRMSYQVRRGFIDRKSARDLYGRVLMRVILATWPWLLNERARRKDPKGWEYCENAVWLARKLAIENLWERGKWRLDYESWDLRDLLQRSLEAGVTSP
jgi:hypothetical protein